MAAVESTGTSTEKKEQYEKYKKFVGRGFLFSPSFYTSSLNLIKTANLIKRYYHYEISRKESYKK